MLRARFLSFLLLLSSLVASFRPAQAAPWAPLAPNACRSIAVPCAQIEDFNLITRLAPIWFGQGTGRYEAGVTTQVAATLALYKTLAVSVAYPITGLRAPGPPAWFWGPLTIDLTWRMGRRMGPGPFGARWPDDEPYPKAKVALYDVRPAPWTAALAFRFVRQGSGVEEVGLRAMVDARIWHFLTTAYGEAVTGEAARFQLGGRVAADIARHFSVFAEALGLLPLGPQAERAGLVLAGAGVRGFNHLHLQVFYGHARGPLTGGNFGGASLDLPLGVIARWAQRLSEAVDPIVAGDGWLYDDECNPMFPIGVSNGDSVYDETRGAWVPIGTHLWRKGNQLCFDRECHQPYGPIRRSPGGLPPLVEGVATLPFSTIKNASAATPEGRAWLHRYFLAPDPARRTMCAQLMRSAIDLINQGVRAPTLADGCREVMAGLDAMGTESDGRLRQGQMPGLALGRLLADAILCQPPGVASVGLMPFVPPKGGGVGKPGTASAAARPMNRRGEPYPQLPDPRTGGEMPFPSGPLQPVPAADRVPWGSSEREAFLREWERRGLPVPPGGWKGRQVHHIRPRLYGGTNDFENLLPLLEEDHRRVTSWWSGWTPS